MDNVTHALAGSVLAALTLSYMERRESITTDPAVDSTTITRSASTRRAVALVGVIAAELPDADVFYAGPLTGMGTLGSLLHHRGHTHTIVFAVLGALVIWGAALALRRELRIAPARFALLWLALAGTLSHVLLDYTNSYGVHPFWPVDNRWYYGDAVFIVEPWLWIVAIPPLFLLVRSVAWRALLGAALAAILVAAWSVDMVERGAAIAFTLGVIAWFAAMRTVPALHRGLWALGAWLVVETTFFVSAAVSRQHVRAAVGTSYRDAALTPRVGNPFCVYALVVTLEDARYRVNASTVAPFASIRDANSCGAPNVGSLGSGDTVPAPEQPRHERVASANIVWGGEWSASRAELASLAASNCEIAAALQFMRVPAWRKLADGRIRFFDLRYSGGGSSWASIDAAARPASCPGLLPGWTPPRSDVLTGG